MNLGEEPPERILATDVRELSSRMTGEQPNELSACVAGDPKNSDPHTISHGRISMHTVHRIAKLAGAGDGPD